ncbi:hypothetical protein [Bauldia sp.]|uniref:hypothetical protein n=1 Tax=Bauldia sp. TaxID=2575872 RepID=UPI003BABBC82
MTATALSYGVARAHDYTCQEMLDYSVEATNRLLHWVNAERNRIAALVSPQDRPAFDALIAKGQCEAAEANIRMRFATEFPDWLCFFGPDSMGYTRERTWRDLIAKNVFPDLQLCFANEGLADSLAAFAEAGAPVPVPFGFDRLINDAERELGPLWREVIAFNSAYSSFKTSCLYGNYEPACIAYVDLARDGIIEDGDDSMVYYVLVRARLAGQSAVGDRALEDAFASRLDADTRAELATDAQAWLDENSPTGAE